VQNYLSGKWESIYRAGTFAGGANSNKRPNRLDWAYTWEKHGFRAKDAPYRLQSLCKATALAQQEFLQVPRRGNAAIKTSLRNDTLAFVFTVPYLLLLEPRVAGNSWTKSGETSWGAAIKLGALAALTLFCSRSTTGRCGSELRYKRSLLELYSCADRAGAAGGDGEALTITLVLPAAEPLYRNSQPTSSAETNLHAARAAFEGVFLFVARGLCLAAAHIGFVVAFYMLQRGWERGAQELNYSDSVNTAFPWIPGSRSACWLR